MSRKLKNLCSVTGCVGQHTSLHRPPISEDIRAVWLKFIYHGNVPDSYGKSLHVCANHFLPDCFINLGQYKAGLALKLCLKEGSIPTVFGEATGDGHVTPTIPSIKHVACQTDPPERTSVGTQLSMKTLQNHVRSKGSQTTVASKDRGVCTLTFPLDSPMMFLQPTIVRRPSKRPRLSLTDEEDGPSE